ncbi:MAG: GNAT family N-acetyltransferase [Deltaproteobacteria bacterium]|nr:GNAT family N-acetyltransferase [Deltaproteobacteria bacterium]
MNDVVIAGYVPGAIGRITELHATYYGRNWDFGLFFESRVATELSEFLRRFDSGRDGFWTASQGECIEGSIAIDGAQAEMEGAHLRWFIVSDAIRGQGTGNRLMEEAVGFCKRKGYSRIFLWTFQGLHPARHLYEKFGFRQVDQVEGNQWGKQVLEQRFVLALR